MYYINQAEGIYTQEGKTFCIKSNKVIAKLLEQNGYCYLVRKCVFCNKCCKWHYKYFMCFCYEY